VLLPRGSFVMGSPADEPGHQASEARAEIHLLPFLLGKHEISQAQWLRATGKNPASGSPTNGVEGVTITLLHPVEAVSWLHGQEFARRLGLRLPTEAQWEYGCRAGSTTAYAFGDDVACLQQHQVNLADASLQRLFEQPFPQQVAWDDGHPYHAPITTGDVNAWGLVAMLGNVAELCRDEWLNQRQPVLTPGDGLAPSSDDSRRVFRGGGWQFGAIYSRSAYREPVHQAESSAVHGLRVERPLL
jgi:formylglycine-generating enzyme required for sulfatase activity